MTHASHLPHLDGGLFLTDEGDPSDLGARHAELRPRMPNVNVLGGCCGTDHRHVSAVCSAWAAGE